MSRRRKPSRVRRWEGPKRALRALASDLERGDLARRLDVAPATVARWLRTRVPRARRDGVRAVFDRHEHALRASHARAVYAHLAARQGPDASRVRRPRRKNLRAENAFIETVETRRAMIEASSSGWLYHLADMLSRGFTKKDARDTWMSPKFKPVR